MKTYSHDYALPSKCERILCVAQILISKDCVQQAEEKILEARKLLQKYLALDNMVSDNDVADGIIKQSETFDDGQIDLIRDLFAEYLEAHPKANYADEILQVINVCQIQTHLDEFESVDQLLSNSSGTWAEIKSEK